MRLTLILIAIALLLSTSSCATHVRKRPKNITVIKTPPKPYTIVKVRGKRYYVRHGKYYKKTKTGYVLVRV